MMNEFFQELMALAKAWRENLELQNRQLRKEQELDNNQPKQITIHEEPPTVAVEAPVDAVYEPKIEDSDTVESSTDYTGPWVTVGDLPESMRSTLAAASRSGLIPRKRGDGYLWLYRKADIDYKLSSKKSHLRTLVDKEFAKLDLIRIVDVPDLMDEPAFGVFKREMISKALYRTIIYGIIPGVKIRGQFYITLDSVDKFVKWFRFYLKEPKKATRPTTAPEDEWKIVPLGVLAWEKTQRFYALRFPTKPEVESIDEMLHKLRIQPKQGSDWCHSTITPKEFERALKECH